MENATKALLIAAAVLIVVLLIVFGVNIFNTAKNAGNAQDTTTTIQTGINSATSNLKTQLGQ